MRNTIRNKAIRAGLWMLAKFRPVKVRRTKHGYCATLA